MRKTRSNSSLDEPKVSTGLSYAANKRQRSELVVVPDPGIAAPSLQPLCIDVTRPRVSSIEYDDDDRYHTPFPLRADGIGCPFVTPRGSSAPPLIDIDVVAAAKGKYDATYAKSIARSKFSHEMSMCYSSFESYQQHATLIMHAVLVDWLCGVAEEHNIPLQTYCLTVHLFDRFITKRIDFSRDFFQLAACAALLVASKLDMVQPIATSDILIAAGDHYTVNQLVSMEADLLLTLNAQLSLPTRHYFTQRFLLASGLRNDRELHFAEYLTMATLLDFSFNEHRMSEVCSSIIHYCRQMFRPPSEEVWTPLLQVTTGYAEAAIANTVYLVQKLHYRLPTVNLQHLNRRFNCDMYSFCSKFIPLRFEDMRFDCASLTVRRSELNRNPLRINDTPCPDDHCNCVTSSDCNNNASGSA